MRVIVYLRVSSITQDTNNQLPALKQWIESRGHELVEIYQEQESAWTEGHQHELARLVRELPKHKVDILLVWALDRLTRQGIGSMLQIVNSFKAKGVQVISYCDSWTEQTGPMLELLYSVYGWAANYEANRISERTLAGLARIKAQGKCLGRPRGSKDKKKRKRSGYFARYAKK